MSKPFSVCASSLPKGLGPQDVQCMMGYSKKSFCQKQNVYQCSSRKSSQAERPNYCAVNGSEYKTKQELVIYLVYILVLMDWDEYYGVSLCSPSPAQSLFPPPCTSLPILFTHIKQEWRANTPTPNKFTYDMPWAWRRHGNKPCENRPCHRVEGSCWHLGCWRAIKSQGRGLGGSMSCHGPALMPLQWVFPMYKHSHCLCVTPNWAKYLPHLAVWPGSPHQIFL